MHTSLRALLPGENGTMQAGIILSGHTDVVPVDKQRCGTELLVTVSDGNVGGHGGTGMKGFIAVALPLTSVYFEMKCSKLGHCSFSFGEEAGCVGVPCLISYVRVDYHVVEAAARMTGVHREQGLYSVPSGRRE
ncbi:hypothetical protein LSCM4_03303 [Leishmania orientalis]|uniref:Uncharacterized protein n=1 Tax=Leishmania orientalis TaxID=2249476 RepID=A0A836GTU9_9TRYP|nr:hypothetical protein LSCM4_03303 [Leishmania orientalis]